MIRLKRLEQSEAVELLERLDQTAALRGAERWNPSMGLGAGYWNNWNWVLFT